jgi:glutaminase
MHHLLLQIATYIPELAKVKPDLWGVAICTVDGQRLELGDSNTKFTIQSAGKCLNYALALDQLTAEMVHKYVGQEQSGTQFNSISLNDQGSVIIWLTCLPALCLVLSPSFALS